MDQKFRFLIKKYCIFVPYYFKNINFLTTKNTFLELLIYLLDKLKPNT